MLNPTGLNSDCSSVCRLQKLVQIDGLMKVNYGFLGAASLYWAMEFSSGMAELLQKRIVQDPLSVIPCFHIHSYEIIIFSGGSAVARANCSRTTMGSSMLQQNSEQWHCLLGWQCCCNSGLFEVHFWFFHASTEYWAMELSSRVAVLLQKQIFRGPLWVLPWFYRILSCGIVFSGGNAVATADYSRSTIGSSTLLQNTEQWNYLLGWQCCCKSGFFEVHYRFFHGSTVYWAVELSSRVEMLLQKRFVRGPLSVIPCFQIHSILSYGMVF